MTARPSDSSKGSSIFGGEQWPKLRSHGWETVGDLCIKLGRLRVGRATATAVYSEAP